MSTSKNKKDIPALVITEKNFQQILDAINDLVFVKGDKSRLLWANKAFCEYYGMTNLDMLQAFGAAVEKPDLSQKYIQDDLKVFMTGKSLNIPQEPIVRHDGVEIAFHTIKSPIFDEKGKVVMSVGVSRNIQTELETRDKLKRNELFLQAILDNTPAVVYAKDLEGHYMMMNKQFANIFKFKREEVLGKTDAELFGKDFAEAFTVNDRLVAKTGRDLQCEEYAPLEDGVHTYISTKFPLRDENGKVYGVCGISTDVTERLRIQQQLEQEKSRAVAQEKLVSLGEMAGGLAHEINTPLSALKTFCSQLIELSGEDSPDMAIVKDIASLMDKTTDNIAALIKNLRTLSRDGSKDAHVSVNIFAMVNEILSLCRAQLAEKDIKLEVMVPANLSIDARSAEVYQVFLNLLNNAVDAATKTKDKWIRIEAKETDQFVDIFVIDSGTGINQIEEQKIFLPFYTTKEIGQGTGLGLSVSKSIADQHNGRLFVDRSCKNTKFVFQLPKVRQLMKKSS